MLGQAILSVAVLPFRLLRGLRGAGLVRRAALPFVSAAIIETSRGIRFRLDLRDDMQWDIFVWHQWEEAETRALEALLGPGAVFYDIGANIGYHTLIGSRAVGAGGRVIAFEPMRCNLECLRANVALNGAANVTIVDRGLAEAEQTAVFAMPRAEFGMASLRPLEHATITEEIHLTTGDAVAAALRLPAPDVVKIDVEGAEYKALVGMRGLLGAARAVLVEVSPMYLEDLGASESQLRDYLAECGFTHSETLSRIRCEDRGRVFYQTNELFTR